ncbi:Rsm22-domain-containing protein [Laetiporus sulphureus 93-53]|uniref:Rsm22-domain-containing protein n=1 Tax=Laetiporus sulphureus 93-53 TaxID=1314785 RepID=A0A165F981_9APHY|nr:Rsm22-domain-containing protein [Laetiporus sulphureus 93-53]KZT08624.1 Rsm22-domain-containing protein [Laetiporus sulphureus 93-53]
MLRSRCCSSLKGALRRPSDAFCFSWSSVASSHQPNAPLDLDPSFQALLKDTDMSLLRRKSRHAASENPHAKAFRELEMYTSDSTGLENAMLVEKVVEYEETPDQQEARKSPAAAYGSQHIGAVVLPTELQQTISRLISESDKHALHADASRIFAHDTEEDAEWTAAYDVEYRSRKQAARHAERDAVAFASIALPSHYSAICSVLDHAKQRLGPQWRVERVIDWGSGAGAGLWASSHSFRATAHEDANPGTHNAQISHSNMSSYTGIDKRMALVKVGERLLKDIEMGGLNVSWQKIFKESNQIPRSEGGDVLALSAFVLSTLPTSWERRDALKEMWQSGADVMVLIDHKTTAGFECIAEARDYLLGQGRKEMKDPATEGQPIEGSHVVAPCPHDGACPLYRPGSSKVVCGFSQRLQRPAFIRKTKHSGIGHEDSGYSYVIIRRGSRPSSPGTKVGRLGMVGKNELAKKALQNVPLQELIIEETVSAKVESPIDPASPASADTIETAPSKDTSDGPENLEEALRLEAYNWPRLVFPPMKKNGHVILDGCTAEGKIMRMTIPKSQGKQPYYDARKSSWGDMFPHEPKNKPQQRFQSIDAQAMKTSNRNAGNDKRNKANHKAPSDGNFSEYIKEQKEPKWQKRRQRVQAREDDFWEE